MTQWVSKIYTIENSRAQPLAVRARQGAHRLTIPFATPALEGEAIWFFGTLLNFKATARHTGGRFSLVEQLGRKGLATPLHRQPLDEETYVVLEGEMRFYLEEQEPISATKGWTVHIPAGAIHAFEVTSDTARWLDLTTPNHELFFRAAGEPAAESTLPPHAPPDMAKVEAAAKEYGVEIVAPPPGAGGHP